MAKNIDQEIARLLKIKEEEVDVINNLKKNNDKLEIVSQRMFNYLSSKNKLTPDIFYYVVDPEIGQYLDDFID